MMKLLIVEDENPQRRVLADGFLSLGYEVFEASDGSVGLELALREHPDIITTDILMPNMDGVTMITKLRMDEWGKKVPIIILSNSEYPEVELRKIFVGYPTYYLIKVDNSITAIIDKINEVVEILK